MKKIFLLITLGLSFPIILAAQDLSYTSSNNTNKKHQISFSSGVKTFSINGTSNNSYGFKSVSKEDGSTESETKSAKKVDGIIPNALEMNLSYSYFPFDGMFNGIGIKALVGWQNSNYYFIKNNFHPIGNGCYVQYDNWNVYSFMAGPSFRGKTYPEWLYLTVSGLFGYSITQIPNVDIFYFEDNSVENLNSEVSGAFSWNVAFGLDIDITKSLCLSIPVFEVFGTNPNFSNHDYIIENGEKEFKKTGYKLKSHSFIILHPKIGISYRF